MNQIQNPSSPNQNSRRDLLRFGAGILAGGFASPFSIANAFDAADLAGQPKLKITSVKTILLRHHLKRPFGVSVSVPLAKTRETLLVKIETDEGLVGWGETALSRALAARSTIRSLLACSARIRWSIDACGESYGARISATDWLWEPLRQR